MKQYSDAEILRMINEKIKNNELSESGLDIAIKCVKSLTDPKDVSNHQMAREMLRPFLNMPKEVPKTVSIDGEKYTSDDFKKIEQYVSISIREIKAYLENKHLPDTVITNLNKCLAVFTNPNSSYIEIRYAHANYRELQKQILAIEGKLDTEVSGRKR